MAKKQQFKNTDTCIADAISMAFGEVQNLADEMRTWFDNAGENLQQSDKFQRIDEAANTLESNVDEPNVEEWIGQLRFQMTEYNRTPKQAAKLSRSNRLGDATFFLQQVIEELDKAEEKYPDEQEKVDEIDSLRTELQNAVDELEGVEFPGMYG